VAAQTAGGLIVDSVARVATVAVLTCGAQWHLTLVKTDTSIWSIPAGSEA